MEKIGVNPSSIDIVVLSHEHNDHIGGIEKFLDKNSKVKVYLLRSFSKEFKNKIAERTSVIEAEDSTQICQSVLTTGKMGEKIPEQSLILKTKNGFTVVTGCAHPGVVKIINKAREIVKNDIFFCIGGWHTHRKTEDEINSIISGLKRIGVKFFGPTHCSGSLIRRILKNDSDYINVGVGKIIEKIG